MSSTLSTPLYSTGSLESACLSGPVFTQRRCRVAMVVGVSSLILLTGEIAGAQQDSNVTKESSGTQTTAPEEVASDSEGDVPSNEVQDSNQKKAARQQMTEEERNAALKFATDNHPELARLLEQLRKSRPYEFARATRELQQQMQLLERIRDKNPARYQSQLDTWKLDSQIRVLTARWSRNQDQELEAKIRSLLRQRRELRISQLTADLVRLAEQQRKLDDQIAAHSEPIEAQVEKEWEQLSKRVEQRKLVERRKAAGSGSEEETSSPADGSKADATAAESSGTKD